MKTSLYILSLSTIAFLCNIAYGNTKQTNGVDANHVKDALVTVVGNNLNGVTIGCGYAIGEGRLIVTAAQNLLENNGVGKHCGLGVATVTSPYLGKSEIAKIIAFDIDSNLAILLTSWKQHPALTLPNISVIQASKTVEVFGLINTHQDDLTYDNIATSSKLPIAKIVDIDAQPALVAMSESKVLTTQWRGAPIMATGTNQVVGCFASTQTNAIGGSVAIGASSNQIALLLQNSEYVDLLTHSEAMTPKRADSHRVYCEYLRYLYALAVNDDTAAAKQSGHKLIALRPDDALGYYCISTTFSQDPNQYDQALHYFQLALKKEPENIASKLNLAHLLLKHKAYDKAEALYLYLFEENYAHELIAMQLGKLYLSQRKPEMLEPILTPILRKNRANGYLWHLRSQLYQMLYTIPIKPDPIDYQSKAIEYMTKYCNLFSDVNIQLALGELLVSYDEIDAAENHYYDLLSINRNNPIVIFHMAKFLHKHRPEMTEEALVFAINAQKINKQAEIGLQPIPDKTLNQLIKKLSKQLEQTNI